MILLRSILFSFSILLFHSLSAEEKGFEDDSLRKLLDNSRYSLAKNYLNKGKIYMDSDSLLCEWYIKDAVIFSITDEQDSAFISLRTAINLAKRQESDLLLFKSNTQLIELYRRNRLYDQALFLIRQMRNDIEIDDPALVCRFYHRSAAVYNEFPQQYPNFIHEPEYLDTAISLSEKSLAMAEEFGFKNSEATSLNELGNIYERTGEYDKALEFYKRTITTWESKDGIYMANALKNLGSYYLRIEKPDSALHYFDLVLNMIKEYNDRNMLVETYWGIKEAYKVKGDSINYLKNSYLEAHHNAILQEELMKQKMFDLSIAYEAKEKDLIIQERNQRLKQEQKESRTILISLILMSLAVAALVFFFFNTRKKNAALRKLLKENEFLVGEANHRIKNNLQLIISIIGREINKSKPSKNKLIEIADKINSIATLHQHLYMTDAKENIAVKDYVYNIIDNFNSSLNVDEIKVDIEVDDFELPIEKSVYLGLLITELLTNTLKHAFPKGYSESKKMNLSLSRNKNRISLFYADNGKGLLKGKEPSLIKLLIMQLKAETLEMKTNGYSINLLFKG